MKKFISLIIISLTTSVFTQEDNPQVNDDNLQFQNENYLETHSQQPPLLEETPAYEVPTPPQTAAYTAPARTNVCGYYDVYLSGAFLYWEAAEDGLELAFTVAANPDGTDNFELLNSITDSLIGFDFKYKPGFRIDLGYNFNYDDWTLNLKYTRFHFSETSTANKPSNRTLRAKWLELAGAYTIANLISLKSNWKMNFNIFDLDLSRTFYEGKQLACSTLFGFLPGFGLKGGWIDQKYSQTGYFRALEPPLLSYNSSDSWFIGPRGGLDGKWHLGQGVSILGNAAASVFMQRFYDIITRHTRAQNPSLLLRNDKSKKELLVNASFEYQLGLHYGTYFNRNKCHFDIYAAYETQIYLSQNEMRSQFDSISTSTDRGFSPASNLGMQGLTLSARFDF